MYCGGVMPGRRQGEVLASTMQAAQIRTAKGSTLLRRRSTWPILVYYLSMVCSHHCLIGMMRLLLDTVLPHHIIFFYTGRDRINNGSWSICAHSIAIGWYMIVLWDKLSLKWSYCTSVTSHIICF